MTVGKAEPQLPLKRGRGRPYKYLLLIAVADTAIIDALIGNIADTAIIDAFIGNIADMANIAIYL